MLEHPTASRRDKRGSFRANNGWEFPSVVINPSSIKARKKRKQQTFYRFLAAVAVCLLLVVRLIETTILRPPPPQTKLDFSNVKNISDLSVDSIEQWCSVEDDSCHCANPLIPEGRQEDQRWEKTHHANKDAMKAKNLDDLDVIFLGDSITEGWQGHFYNRHDDRVAGALEVFQGYFSKKHKGKYEGLAQGISGDKIPNLLWRIQNGEVRTYSDFHSGAKERMSPNPIIFWVLIGTNDMHHGDCSPDMVVLGIIRIVEELLFLEPAALVVINGILPRTFDKSDGYLMKTKDNLPIFWPTIETINSHLKTYAEKRDQVDFFDATHVFVENYTATDNTALRIDRSLMNDFLHPSAKGYRKWGQLIVARIDSLLSR